MRLNVGSWRRSKTVYEIAKQKDFAVVVIYGDQRSNFMGCSSCQDLHHSIRGIH